MDAEEEYERLFDNNDVKAEAFDMIAREFYFRNFGSIQKSDLETLLFSIYIERILSISESEFKSYSDYTLSKLLGISQTKISNLKVKKELKYPYSKFDWRKSFLRLLENARFEKDRILVNIPDKNLYLEIKNAIEERGGYIEATLSSELLKVRPEYYVDLLVELCEETSRKELVKHIKEKLNRGSDDTEYFSKTSIGKAIKDASVSAGLDVAAEAAEILGSFNPVSFMAKGIVSLIKHFVEFYKK